MLLSAVNPVNLVLFDGAYLIRFKYRFILADFLSLGTNPFRKLCFGDFDIVTERGLIYAVNNSVNLENYNISVLFDFYCGGAFKARNTLALTLDIDLNTGIVRVGLIAALAVIYVAYLNVTSAL